MKKKNKAIKIFTDRMLTGERDESSPYITAALYFLVGLMSLMLILVVFVSMCGIDGESMMPSYRNGDNVLLYKFPSEFERGDVVVFDIEKEEGKGSERLIKRIVATAGDDVLFVRHPTPDEHGRALVDLYRRDSGTNDFYLVEETFLSEPMLASKVNESKISPDTTSANAEAYKIHVDEGCLFVLGDNRNNSTDSRAFGQIPASAVVGKEIFHFTQGSLLEKIMLILFNSGFSKEVQ